jgi:hypothetical protein
MEAEAPVVGTQGGVALHAVQSERRCRTSSRLLLGPGKESPTKPLDVPCPGDHQSVDIGGVGVLLLPHLFVRPQEAKCRDKNVGGGTHNMPLARGHLTQDIREKDLAATPLLHALGLQPVFEFMAERKDGVGILLFGGLDLDVHQVKANAAPQRRGMLPRVSVTYPGVSQCRYSTMGSSRPSPKSRVRCPSSRCQPFFS